MGFTVSVMVHIAAGLLAAGIVVASSGTGGDSSQLSADVALTTLTETELTELKDAEIASGAPKEALPELAPPTIDLADAATSVANAATTPATDVSGLGGAGVGGAGGASGGAFGDGAGLGGAGGGGTRFFGVEAVGSRFAYIVDVSGSMAGPKLESLKRELESSIDALTEHAHYTVILFSSEATPLGGRAVWNDASTRQKRATFQMISSIQASGATNPAPAFELAFAIRPRPDAVYFMTDGLFAAEVVPQVETLNRNGGSLVPIHCIAFTSRESEHLLKRMAEVSDGTYTYISGPRP